MNNKNFQKWWAENYKDLDHRDILRTTEKAWKESYQKSASDMIELCVKVVESFKQADPYTGEEFNTETNTILRECIEELLEMKDNHEN
jgi:thymidylate synthase ThyX